MESTVVAIHVNDIESSVVHVEAINVRKINRSFHDRVFIDEDFAHGAVLVATDSGDNNMNNTYIRVYPITTSEHDNCNCVEVQRNIERDEHIEVELRQHTQRFTIFIATSIIVIGVITVVVYHKYIQ